MLHTLNLACVFTYRRRTQPLPRFSTRIVKSKQELLQSHSVREPNAPDMAEVFCRTCRVCFATLELVCLKPRIEAAHKVLLLYTLAVRDGGPPETRTRNLLIKS